MVELRTLLHLLMHTLLEYGSTTEFTKSIISELFVINSCRTQIYKYDDLQPRELSGNDLLHVDNFLLDNGLDLLTSD